MPQTRESLTAGLRALGVRPGSVLLVHASLRSLGWVCGAAQAVVQALLDAVGPTGTLVVPTHTPMNTDPDDWTNPPVPPQWGPVVRTHMPAFDPRITPSRWMGAVAEQLRTWPDAVRSDHPQVSFAALGPAAAVIVADHARTDMLGEHSPLARVYDLAGDVLLLGVGHDSNTSLHLAEYRQPAPPRARTGSAVRTGDGGRAWVWWEDVATEEDDFPAIGAALAEAGLIRSGPVGAATAQLMGQRAVVDFAVAWMGRHRLR